MNQWERIDQLLVEVELLAQIAGRNLGKFLGGGARA